MVFPNQLIVKMKWNGICMCTIQIHRPIRAGVEGRFSWVVFIIYYPSTSGSPSLQHRRNFH